MTEWGIRRVLVAVEEAELEAHGECQRNEDDQRGCGEEGHAHGGSLAWRAETVKAAGMDVI